VGTQYRKDLCGSVRAVYVLEKLPDVNGPGLVEAGRYTRPSPSAWPLPPWRVLLLARHPPIDLLPRCGLPSGLHSPLVSQPLPQHRDSPGGSTDSRAGATSLHDFLGRHDSPAGGTPMPNFPGIGRDPATARALPQRCGCNYPRSSSLAQ
jgi:hypothetical protein